MNEIKKAALHTIDAHANTFTAISGAIWDEPELSLKEFKAAALYTDALEKLGFTVQKNLCGIETAFFRLLRLRPSGDRHPRRV